MKSVIRKSVALIMINTVLSTLWIFMTVGFFLWQSWFIKITILVSTLCFICIIVLFLVREPGDSVSKATDKVVASTQDIYAGN